MEKNGKVKLAMVIQEVKDLKAENANEHFEIKATLNEVKSDLKCLPEKMSGQFAPKWIEKFVYWLIITLAGGFITLLIYLIQRHIL